MDNRKEVLKQLFPEDILNISEGLTDGEVEFLRQLVELLETKYRPVVNQAWVDAEVPKGFLKISVN